MRIAYFVDRFPSLSVTFIVNEIAALLRREHDVEIFAAAAGDLDVVHPDVEEYGLLERTTSMGVPRNRLRRIPWGLSQFFGHLDALLPMVRALDVVRHGQHAYSLRLLAGVTALHRRRDYDVVHAHFGPNGELAVRLRSIGVFAAPVVTTFHGYGIRRGIEGGGAIYEQLRRQGDLFLAISGYNRRHLEAFGFPAERIVDHAVGIDLRRFPFRPRILAAGESVRILSVATLYPVKGHDVGLQALAQVRQQHPGAEIEYRIAGGGPLEGELRRRIEALGLQSAVTLLGPCTSDQVRAELDRAHLFLLPSRAEATPVALMEAQACGLPVVATRVGAVDEVVRHGETGFLVPPEDPTAMAQPLAEVIRQPDRWQRWGTAGRHHVEARYDSEKLADRLVAQFERLADVNAKRR